MAAMRILLMIATVLFSGPIWADLRDYVEKPDAAFAWRVLESQHDGAGAAEVVGGRHTATRAHAGESLRIALTSQTWRGGDWNHTLYVTLPPEHDGSLALLFVGGGPIDGDAAALAARVRAPVAVIDSVPNQPLLGGKREDDLIAETFMRFLTTGEGDWPLLLPMVKSVTRAMDALQAFGRTRGMELSGFVVTGASKRGWTTWLTAAVDPRVRGLAPRVIDMLNIPAQMPHQLRSWGTYSEMLAPYTKPGLPSLIEHPQGRQLVSLVDPYAYRERIEQPKLIMLGTNDRYWALDALNQYWEGLRGEKNVLYVPNAGHGLRDESLWQSSLACFFRAVSAGRELPTPSMTAVAREGTLQVQAQSSAPAEAATLWHARAGTRDFREATWTGTPMRRDGAMWRAQLALDAATFTASTVTLTYARDGEQCPLSTPVEIRAPAP